MGDKNQSCIPSDNRNLLAIVEALADWIIDRRASRDYGSLVGEYEDNDAVYGDGQSNVIVIEAAGQASSHPPRGRS